MADDPKDADPSASDAAIRQKIAKMTSRELVDYASGGNVWRQGFINLEMQHRLITALVAVDASASFWSRWLFRLTVVLAVLTLILVALTVVLIWRP